MAKSYKKKSEIEVASVESEALSKKEQYDLEKKKRIALKEKENKKKDKPLKKKVQSKKKETNVLGRVFAIAMLVLMVGSVIISALAYVVR